MTTSQNYSINPYFGNYDFMSIMNNPCFQQVAQSPNVNFKASPNSTKIDTTAVQNLQQQDSIAGSGGIPVVNNTQTSSSNGCMNFAFGAGLTILAGGACLAFIGKNPGGINKFVKSIFNKTASSSTDVVSGKLSRLTAVKAGKNDIRFMIPGKTVTIRGGSAITKFVNSNGIKEAISLKKQAFDAEKSAITGFVCKSSTNNYIIKLENGTITSIKDKSGKEILEDLTNAAAGTPEAQKLEAFENIVKELGKSKDIDKTVLDGVSSIRYTNTVGDDVLEMSMAKYGDTPMIRKFTTLQRFKFSDKEIQALKLEAGEGPFALSKFYKDGKLVDGLKVEKFDYDIGGNICHFEGETLVSIKAPDGTILPQGSAGYDSLKEKYQKDIDKLIRLVYVKRKIIPNGATIIPD